MLSTLIVFVVALAVTATMTPLVRRVALAVGAVDEPTARRVHTRRIPRMGGIAIVVGFFAPLLAIFALNTEVAKLFFGRPRLVAGMVVGALVVAGLGLLDDIMGIGAKRKFLVQTAAAIVAYAAGFRIDAVSLPVIGTVQLGWLALPATILWITGIINALNLIDGLDGLAAGVAFFACVTNFVVAFLSGNVLICLLSAALAGAILGFLIHNFNPATIFMGDSGSMFLGFILATVSLSGAASQKGTTAIAILVPILALGLPIMDTLFAMVRRFLERRSIFSPDRGHIHHRLLDLGLTHRRAVLLLYAMSLLFTLAALAIYIGRSWQVGVALVLLMVSLVGIVRFVGYFDHAMLRLRQREQRRDPRVEQLRRLVPLTLAKVASARTADDVRNVLEHFAREAKMLAVELVVPPEADIRAWRWELPDVGERIIRDAISATFALRGADSHAIELKFQWDGAAGEVSPQEDILLQLVCDAVESVLQRGARVREAKITGRLRPVS